MSLRALSLLSRRFRTAVNGRLLELRNPTLIQQLFPNNHTALAESELISRIDGVAMAALALDAVFVIGQPPRNYREAIERRLAHHGLVAAYEEYRVDPNGSLMLMGFRLGNHLPEPGTHPQLECAYLDWTDHTLTRVDESQLPLLVSPWQTFLQNQLYDIFMESHPISH